VPQGVGVRVPSSPFKNEEDGWPDQVQLISEWQLRGFLGYVASSHNRWDKNSKNCRAEVSHFTLRHYYIGLHALFS
jgi:hypothetical protein